MNGLSVLCVSSLPGCAASKPRGRAWNHWPAAYHDHRHPEPRRECGRPAGTPHWRRWWWCEQWAAALLCSLCHTSTKLPPGCALTKPLPTVSLHNFCPTSHTLPSFLSVCIHIHIHLPLPVCTCYYIIACIFYLLRYFNSNFSVLYPFIFTWI